MRERLATETIAQRLYPSNRRHRPRYTARGLAGERPHAGQIVGPIDVQERAELGVPRAHLRLRHVAYVDGIEERDQPFLPGGERVCDGRNTRRAVDRVQRLRLVGQHRHYRVVALDKADELPQEGGVYE